MFLVNWLKPNSPYSFGERIFRTGVYQIGVEKGFFERCLIKIHAIFRQKTLCPKILFNQEIAKARIESYRELGGVEAYLTPEDNMAKIFTISLNSQKLEEAIKYLGGEWKKIKTKDGRTILAIIPPKNSSRDWEKFKLHLLRFKWKEEDIELEEGKGTTQQRVIVTCETAQSIQEKDYHKKIFIHANSASVSSLMLTKRAAFYIGCKANIKFYDPRGTGLSIGTPSGPGYNNDIMAVYDSIKDTYSPENIWVTAACAGCFPAAYLKSKTHNRGLNFIFENGFVSLKRDFLPHEGRIVTSFTNRYWGGLSAKDFPCPKSREDESEYDMEKLWKDLKQTDLGKVIIVSVHNDQRLSGRNQEDNMILALKVNKNAIHIDFLSNRRDAHFDRYYHYKDSTDTAIATIYGN